MKMNNSLKKQAKDLNRHLTEQNIQIANNIWKDAQHHTSGKCKLKHYTPIRIAEIQNLTPPNADKNV